MPAFIYKRPNTGFSVQGWLLEMVPADEGRTYETLECVACGRMPPTNNGSEEGTAPYFHDGSASTLAVAVKQMGLAQLDRVLSDSEVASIVAFLNTLTGSYRGRPVVPPAAAPRADTAPP